MHRFTSIIAALVLLAIPAFADTNSTPANVGSDEAAWSQHVVDTFKVLQEQQQDTQRAIQQAREEAQAEAKRSNAALESRLAQLEQTVSNQHVREINSLNSTHRATLKSIFILGGAGLLGLVVFGLAVLRAVNRRPATVPGWRPGSTWRPPRRTGPPSG